MAAFSELGMDAKRRRRLDRAHPCDLAADGAPVISGYLVGDKALIASLHEMSPAVKTEVDRTVQKLGFALQSQVQRNYLRGPRPGKLGVVTGRLINSIAAGGADSRSRFVSTDNSAFYWVGTNVKYAAVHEFGFNGLVPVKPYIRHSYKISFKLKPMSQRKVASKLDGEIIYSHDSYQRVLGKVIGYAYVNGFFRHMNMPARPFLAPALEDMRQTIVTELGAALRRGAITALKGR